VPKVASWDDVRRLALALLGTSETPSPDGLSAWRVKDKLFVWERPLRRVMLSTYPEACQQRLKNVRGAVGRVGRRHLTPRAAYPDQAAAVDSSLCAAMRDGTGTSVAGAGSVDVSNATESTAVATASALTSNAKLLTFPVST
jgi:hypothetical protein